MRKSATQIARLQKQTYDAARADLPGQNIKNQVAGSVLPPGGPSGSGYPSAPHTHPLTDLEQGGATDGQIVTWSSDDGAFVPADPAGGLTNPMTTAEDLIVGGASGVPDRLGVGSNGDVLTVVAGSVGWAAPAGGGGGGGMQILSVQADSSSSDGGTPTNATLVPDLTITIAGSATARRALVSYSFAYTATHTNHINLFLDSTIVFPKTGIASFPGTTDAADSVFALGPSDSSPATYYATLAEYVVTIPGDSASHDIIVKYNAAANTTATTFYARSLVVKLIADSDDVTL